ncbi:WXG100 family type VII secretion target [Streptomyces sp. HUAS ZL42]|uniref:WXG100 family type VII secretion target n=1 Tax=Streptomyces sp. HUAS ZL42 TaxID=3231715 RepID=UPI00345E53FA
MSGEQKHQSPHQEELDQAVAQVGAIDMVNRVANIVPFVGNIRVFGKTDFEGHALNAMIDMVDSANPEHLASAGNALLDASESIQKAADELSGHIPRVDWEGESGTAFRDWGNNLVLHASNLATFAQVSGTQMQAAATGLASVRKAMPPRDTRPDPTQTPSDIPTPEQISTNKEYAAAVKAEQDRQEAINQMNRLASFYAVSEEMLAAQEPPTFEAMPDVGVPKPTVSKRVSPAESGDYGSSSSQSESGVVTHHSTESGVDRSRTHDALPTSKELADSISPSGRHVGTEIDSVGTVPPQETAKPVTVTPSSPTGPGGTTAGTVPPFAAGTLPPTLGGQTGRTTGFSGARAGNTAPVTAQGRAGTPSGTAAGRGTTGPMGRATAMGQPGVRGAGTAVGKSPIGHGISGGTPRATGGTTGAGAGGTGSTGAARGNGVVGGRPTAGTAQGATGSRVPRGTVVGSEGNTGSRTPAGKIGQRGVIGAPNSTPGPRSAQTARPTAGNPDGVVGTPTGRAPAGRGGDFAAGGAGAPHGQAGNRRNTNRKDDRQPEAQRRNAPPAAD